MPGNAPAVTTVTSVSVIGTIFEKHVYDTDTGDTGDSGTTAAQWNAQLDEWAAGLERMRGHPPPSGFSERSWYQYRWDALALLGCHGPRLAALGWQTCELFALHRTHPAARVAASGLARFIHGGSITDITDQYARVRHLTGAILTYRRTDPQPGAVPAWELHTTQGGNDMADYSTGFDTGAQDTGPWLIWHASATRDGAHKPGTWSVKDASGTRTAVNLTPGFVLDWPASKTGWMQASGVPGVAPKKQWNASRSKFERQPGDDFKKAIHAPVAYLVDGTPAFAIWEQNSVAAFMGFADLMTQLFANAAAELPKLPVLAFTTHRQVKLSNGVTLVPVFQLKRFVARPVCLPDPDAIAQPQGDAWGGSAQPAPKPPASANGAAGAIRTAGDVLPLPSDTAPADGPLIDDEIPF
jgi:hypothetical protein